MSSYAIGVLADDLTGALASASRLHSAGWRPYVAVDTHLGVPQNADTVVVNTRTRDFNYPPRETIASGTRALRQVGCERIELRVDTTLRGAPAEELEGFLEGLGDPETALLAVPAHPEAGRVTRDGVQLTPHAPAHLARVDVQEALFPKGRVAVVRLDVVRAGVDAVVSHIAGQHRRGTRRFIGDAECEQDLATLAAAAAHLPAIAGSFATISSGAWLRYYPARGAIRRVVVVLLGSPTATNLAQRDLLASRYKVVTLDPETVIEAHGLPEPFVSGVDVVLVDTSLWNPTDGSQAAEPIARRGAAAVAEVLADLRGLGWTCAGVIATGGHAASLLLDALQASQIDVLGEALPLCSAFRIAGGPWAGLSVVAKGGLVGDESALSTIATHLLDRDEIGGSETLRDSHASINRQHQPDNCCVSSELRE